MEEAGHRHVSDGWKETLVAPITADELKAAVYKGDSKKFPGRDGIGVELFKVLWNDMESAIRLLYTQMSSDHQLSERQKQVVIVCILKTVRPGTHEDYRPLTLLNTDYKIVARLIAAGMRSIMADLLHPSQYCGVPGNKIFDAVATVRDAITYAETERRPLCVISLDFKERSIEYRTRTSGP